MTLPFTPQAFFGVFARYNEVVWPMPVVLAVLGLAALAFLVRPSRISDRVVTSVLSLLWLWMAVAYHLAFFTAINGAAFVFAVLFLVEGLLIARAGLLRAQLHFELGRDRRSWLVPAFVAYGLVLYPVLGWLLGHRYPAMPTFGLPCPTTIYTLGLLLAARSCPLHLLVIPAAWSLLGSVAAWQLGVPQDYGLLVAGILATLTAVRARGAADTVPSIVAMQRQ